MRREYTRNAHTTRAHAYVCISSHPPGGRREGTVCASWPQGGHTERAHAHVCISSHRPGGRREGTVCASWPQCAPAVRLLHARRTVFPAEVPVVFAKMSGECAWCVSVYVCVNISARGVYVVLRDGVHVLASVLSVLQRSLRLITRVASRRVDYVCVDCVCADYACAGYECVRE